MTLAATAAYGCRALPAREPAPGPPDLDAIAAAIVEGGQRLDGIPAIDHPFYDVVGAEQLPRTVFTPHVGLGSDDDLVDALVAPGGVPHAYPRFITVWHEVVNESFAGEPVSITYCPLTGSTLVFSGRLAGDVGSTFGVSGRILHSNLVMFDRESTSFWPQLLGVAVSGPRKGQKLHQLPLAVTTTLGRWRARFPRTLVLTTLTGSLRPYGSWPYGSEYDRDGTLLFPVPKGDDRFAPKHVFYGVTSGDAAAAVDKAAALERGVIMFEVGGRAHVAIADAALQAVRVFRAQAGPRELTLEPYPAGATDRETGSRWSYMGIAIGGELGGERLEQVPGPEVFWFAWHAFHPQTLVVA